MVIDITDSLGEITGNCSTRIKTKKMFGCINKNSKPQK